MTATTYPRIRLVSTDGRDYPAWNVNGVGVFQIDEEQAIDGRRWVVFDARTLTLIEAHDRDDAFAIAEERTKDGDE